MYAEMHQHRANRLKCCVLHSPLIIYDASPHGSMATDKLYMASIDDCYQTEFTAEVDSVTTETVTLDRTLFYALGGGQEPDTGTLSTESVQSFVRDVRGRDIVTHTVGEDHGFEVGDEVVGRIDWDRRHAHMRMHTAQHLISGLAYEMFDGARTVGNQIHHHRSRIDFKPIKFEEGMIEELVALTNSMIEAGAEVRAETMTKEQVNAKMPPERSNMDLLPQNIDELRVIRIGADFDICPCAGTHVRNISEIGEVEFLSKKSKGKGTQRFSYTLQGLKE